MKLKFLLFILFTVGLCACRGNTTRRNSLPDGDFSAETFQAILEQLELKSEDCYPEFISQQAFADDESLSVWLIPQITDMQTDEFDNASFSLSCRVLLADNKKGKIVACYDDPFEIDSDACRLVTLSIDSAAYRLGDDRSAFGISASCEASSRIFPTGNTSTTLFIRQGDALKKVIEYAPAKYHGETMDGGERFFEKTDARLIVSDTKNNGLFDIIVRENSENTYYAGEGGDYHESVEFDTDFRFYRYDGSRYTEGAPDEGRVLFEEHIVDGAFKEYFHFGKTAAQVYEILKGEDDHYQKFLLPEMPAGQTEYEVWPEDAENEEEAVYVSYGAPVDNSRQIWLHSDCWTITISITEKKNFTELTVKYTD